MDHIAKGHLRAIAKPVVAARDRLFRHWPRISFDHTHAYNNAVREGFQHYSDYK